LHIEALKRKPVNISTPIRCDQVSENISLSRWNSYPTIGRIQKFVKILEILLLGLQLSYWRNIYSPTPLISYFQDEFNHFLAFLAYELFVYFYQYRSPLFAYKVWTLPILVTAANSPICLFSMKDSRNHRIIESSSLREMIPFQVTSDCRNGILRSWNKWTDSKILSDFMNWQTEFWESLTMNWNSRTCIIAAIIYITQRLCSLLRYSSASVSPGKNFESSDDESIKIVLCN
jgi:hypothetical protein